MAEMSPNACTCMLLLGEVAPRQAARKPPAPTTSSQPPRPRQRLRSSLNAPIARPEAPGVPSAPSPSASGPPVPPPPEPMGLAPLPPLQVPAAATSAPSPTPSSASSTSASTPRPLLSLPGAPVPPPRPPAPDRPRAGPPSPSSPPKGGEGCEATVPPPPSASASGRNACAASGVGWRSGSVRAAARSRPRSTRSELGSAASRSSAPGHPMASSPLAGRLEKGQSLLGGVGGGSGAGGSWGGQRALVGPLLAIG